MAKILVTGGAGFIGSNFANAMFEKGEEVVVLDNLFLGREDNLVEGVKFVRGDVRKKEDLMRAGDDFDYVVHLAASSSAPMFADDLYGACENNICGHIRVIEFAKEVGVKKVLFASTSSIYGNNPTPLKEDQEVVPPNYYAVTKFSQEQISRIFSQVDGLEILGFRFMSVYGLNERHKGRFANLVSQFIWGMKKGERPVIYGDGMQERDFTNVRDVVQGIEKGMRSEKKFGFEVFNIGTEKSVNLIDLVKIINEEMGSEIEPEHIPNPVKEGYVRSQLASTEKIERELGYKAEVGLREGIGEIIKNLGDVED